MHKGILSPCFPQLSIILKSCMRAKSQPTKPEPIETERTEEGFAAVSHASCSLKNNCCCLMNYFKLSIKVKIKKWFMRSARRISLRCLYACVLLRNKGLAEKMFLPPTTEAKTTSARASCGRWVSWERRFERCFCSCVCGIAQSAPK
jgi:hypothetical protein